MDNFLFYLGKYGLIFAEILIVLAIIGMVLGIVFNLMQNFKAGIKFIAGFAVMILIFLIAKFTASGIVPSKIETTKALASSVQGGMALMYVLLIVAFGALVYSMVKSLMDNA